VTNLSAIAIGAVAGLLVVGGMVLLERLRIDDPVGAWPVHGLCGMWGGIATAIFGGVNIGVQLLGTVVYSGWAFATMFGLFALLKAVGWLRVSEDDEIEGLDITEHGMVNYPEFVNS
jgi:Amt family ammonium transporter